jgi:hypothetical protein
MVLSSPFGPLSVTIRVLRSIAVTVAVMTAALSFTTLGCSAGAAPLVACAKTPVDRDRTNTTAAARTNNFFISSILSFHEIRTSDLLNLYLIINEKDPMPYRRWWRSPCAVAFLVVHLIIIKRFHG